MKIAICDDELIFAKEIEDEVRKVLEKKGIDARVDVFTDCTQLYACEELYDIAFLDICMTPYDGLALAKKMQKINENITVFFITSFDKYLDDALDINAFRYIQKPIDTKRLAAGFEKAIDNIVKSESKFFVKDGQSFVAISSSSIILVQIVGRHTEVVTEDKQYYSENSIDFWTERLASPLFYRVHKSYIINMNYITDYSRSRVVLNNSHEIPVAYRNQADFKRCFFRFFGGTLS